MNITFEGRTALVTGAGHGSGRAIAGAFATRGAHVFACDVNDSVRRRGYVWLMGLGGTVPTDYFEQELLMKQDPEAAFVEFYPQDQTLPSFLSAML